MRSAIGALVVVGMLAAPARVFASEQETTPESSPTWTIQIDPLTLALGFAHVQVERALAERVSIYAGPSIRLWDPLKEDDDPSYYGIGVEAGLRVYVRGQAPVGTWLMVRGVAARVTDDDDNSDFGGYVSLLVGHHFVFGRWLLGAGLGVNFMHYSVDGTGSEGILPAAHTTIGTVF